MFAILIVVSTSDWDTPPGINPFGAVYFLRLQVIYCYSGLLPLIPGIEAKDPSLTVQSASGAQNRSNRLTVSAYRDIANTVEKLKNEHVCPWLRNISQTHHDVLVSCLLPHPPEYTRVGGHWDNLASKTSHLKDGLNRLYCLIPYGIVTQEIWDYIMPHWMEAICTDVPEKELLDLKVVVGKILEPDVMISVEDKNIYNFAAMRFQNTEPDIQMSALIWFQTISFLEVKIPLPQLFDMFSKGVQKLPEKSAKTKEEGSGDSNSPSSETGEHATAVKTADNLTCCILMLDILLKQMELQQRRLPSQSVSSDATKLLRLMLKSNQLLNLPPGHCSIEGQCTHCEASALWHQLSVLLVKAVTPEKPNVPPEITTKLNAFLYVNIKNSDALYGTRVHLKRRRYELGFLVPPSDDFLFEGHFKRQSEEERSSKSGGAATPATSVDALMAIAHPLGSSDRNSVGGVLVHMPHVCIPFVHFMPLSLCDLSDSTSNTKSSGDNSNIMTATVETITEQLDMAVTLPPSDHPTMATAHTITLTEADVATATADVCTPNLLGDHETMAESVEEDISNFWATSAGKFHFSIEELPQELQYMHQLLQELKNTTRPDILYHLLQCLHVLVLNADVLSDHRGFLIWCQENLLIENLWNVCDAKHSHICSVAVPILLHCVTLAGGADVFCNLIRDEFHHPCARLRFAAVERVTVIIRLRRLNLAALSQCGLEAVKDSSAMR
ncbi:Protein unc-79 homolog [Eumeta japonica]|uniref:Protein unc-79 homolog n=1 Tax=Eumeta variegata TaxID=151549 RepID=A0A4C1UR16_EUMVA|nr:Protein unc-79 homolog [Eumeta japonica]